MTQQEYLDLILDTFEAGGFPAAKPGTPTCRLRTSEGKKCHVGLLIPDSQYVQDLEGRSLEYLLRSGCLTPVNGFFWQDYSKMLRVHDQAVDIYGVLRRLKYLRGLEEVFSLCDLSRLKALIEKENSSNKEVPVV